jgi:hypothetical protein
LTVEKEEDNDNILGKEIESWKGFEYALRGENSSCCLNDVNRMSKQ